MELYTHTGPQSCFRKSSGDKLAGPSFAGDRSRQQDRCVAFLKLDPPPIQCAARVNSLLTEQSSYNFNSVISFSTFTRRTAYSWQRVQFETTTLAHLLATCVPSKTREPGKVPTVDTEYTSGGSAVGAAICCTSPGHSWSDCFRLFAFNQARKGELRPRVFLFLP